MITTWEAIFPTPILRTNIGREFTEKELAFFGRAQEKVCTNVLNSRTADTYVLNAPELRDLRSFIEAHVEQFARKTISIDERIEFYITQSWINFTETGQSHHRHFHTNSLVSGVLYISALKDVDRIYFYRPSLPGLCIGKPDQNWYAADSWFFSVGAGDLLLFPSSLTHGVEEVKGRHIRVSLAFNAFVKGKIGEEDRLNAVELGVS